MGLALTKPFVDSRLRFDSRSLESVGVSIDDLKLLCTYRNPEFEEAKSRLAARGVYRDPANIPRTIKTWREEDNELSLPRGVLRLPQLWAILRPFTGGARFGEDWTKHFEDRRILGDPEARKVVAWLYERLKADTSWSLRDFQLELQKAAFIDETALWNSPQGSGKTESGLATGIATGLPTLILSPSSKVFEEWQRRCALRIGYEPGTIVGGKRVLKPITIAMIQTMRNCVDEYKDYFGTVIVDEAQFSAAETFTEVVDKFPAKYRIGVTADERRADGKEDIVYDVFGPVSHKVERDILVSRGYILDAKIRIVPTNFGADGSAEWYTKLRPDQKKISTTKLIQQMYEDQGRNALIQEVLDWCKGEQTMVLSLRVEHCRMLDSQATARGYKSGRFLGGQKHKKEFDSCFERMFSGDLEVAFGTYQAVGVGFNLPQLTRGIFALPRANSKKSEMQVKQFLGRYERPDFNSGKKSAEVYYLFDQHIYSVNVIKQLQRWRPVVEVWSNGKWVSSKEWLREHREKEDRFEAPGQFSLEPVTSSGPRASKFIRKRRFLKRAGSR